MHMNSLKKIHTIYIMNPVKTYQNISYKELIACSENNPNRSFALDSIEIQKSSENEDIYLTKLGLPNYMMHNVHPTGVLGAITCISDPGHYYLAPKNVRTQLIIDLATSLQQKTDNLKNTPIARKRKRMYDLIGEAYNCKSFEDKDYYDLFNGLTYLCNMQFILIKETVQDNIEEGKTNDSAYKGEILFSSNPTTWKKEHPMHIVDYRGRWVASSHENSNGISNGISTWLSEIEKMGWMVQWPEIEGTKVELVEKLSKYSQETDKKVVKEILSVRLGKIITLETIKSFA